MSWPTSPQQQSPRRQSRRPKPPPLTLRQVQRRNRRRVAMRIAAVTVLAIVLPLALAIVVVIAIGRADRPAAVPPDFRPPTALPVAASALPTNHMLFTSDRNGSFGIYAMRNDGQMERAILEDPEYDSWGVRISPDRATALFYRAPAGTGRDPATAGLWAVATDGTAGPVLLRPAGLDGWVVQTHAEWHVYGASLVMAGGSRDDPKVYTTNALGQNPQLLTNRPGPNTDPSYRAPDGQDVIFVGCPGEACEPQDRELYRIPGGGGDPVRLTNDRRREREPYVSPAGDRVAFVSFEGAQPGDGWQLRIADIGPDGSLSRPRSLLAMSGEPVVGRPQWSLDGSTIYVHRQPAGRATTGIFAISVTTTAAARELTLGKPGNQEDPSL